MAEPPSNRSGNALVGKAGVGTFAPNEFQKSDVSPPRKSELMSETMPPFPQGNSFDVANQVVRENYEQQRRHTAAIAATTFNSGVFDGGPFASDSIGGGGGAVNATQPSIYGNELPASTSVSAEIFALLEKLRGYHSGLQAWIGELRASTPNETETQAQYLSLIDFLEGLATGIAEVADGLEHAISAGTNDAPEPILLGKAAIVARKASEKAQRWLDEQGTIVIDMPVKLAVFGGALITLSHFGISGDALTNAVAGYILGASIKKKE